MISFSDFQKLDLRVAQIKTAEKVAGSDKLIKLVLDIGEEERQVLAGIAKRYQPEELINKKIAIIANLEPRTIFGYESQGMVLAADLEGEPFVLFVNDDVSPGAKIR